jgi:rubrerythrin
MPNHNAGEPATIDGIGSIGTHKQERVTYSCSDCDEFEMGKRFTGVSGTDGEREYEEIEPPDECPVCGGEIEEETVSN